MTMSNGWKLFKGRNKTADQGKTSLTFTDVIFGLVITQIFVQAVPFRKLSGPVLVHLGLATVVVLGSYIGYRRSLKRGEPPLYFFSLSLLRFMLDLAMIFLYYLLVVTPDTTKDPATAHVSSRFDAVVGASIFLLFLLWDLVSTWMAAAGYQVGYSWLRTFLTFAFLAVSAGVLALAHHEPRSAGWAIKIDTALIVLNLAYRWLKDSAPSPKPKLPPRPNPTPRLPKLTAQPATTTNGPPGGVA